ncbi:MAG: potassium channel family protein [Alphaproteobacteria bacterium]
MGSSTEAATGEAAPSLKKRLRRLYHGDDRAATRFRWLMLAVDVVTIALFVELTFVADAGWMIGLEFGLGAILLADLSARLYIDSRPWALLLKPLTLVDAVVVFSLLAAPFTDNLGFLRILRTLRLLRSYHVIGILRRHSLWVRHNEEIIHSTINLIVFVFMTTAAVFVTQHEVNPQIDDYIDALYFTVTTLTTTGFGDITLTGEWGRILSVIVMILGISLFLRLLQAIFQPAKVHAPCPHCGLSRHDPDAVHCKHCGKIIHIETGGAA